MVKIATLSSQIELEMLTELFNQNGIDVFPEYREAGVFLTLYMGNTPYGIDIFVPNEQADEARRLYDLFFDNQEG